MKGIIQCRQAMSQDAVGQRTRCPLHNSQFRYLEAHKEAKLLVVSEFLSSAGCQHEQQSEARILLSQSVYPIISQHRIIEGRAVSIYERHFKVCEFSGKGKSFENISYLREYLPVILQLLRGISYLLLLCMKLHTQQKIRFYYIFPMTMTGKTQLLIQHTVTLPLTLIRYN